MHLIQLQRQRLPEKKLVHSPYSICDFSFSLAMIKSAEHLFLHFTLTCFSCGENIKQLLQIVIYQWQADQLFVNAESRAILTSNYIRMLSCWEKFGHVHECHHTTFSWIHFSKNLHRGNEIVLSNCVTINIRYMKHLFIFCLIVWS